VDVDRRVRRGWGEVKEGLGQGRVWVDGAVEGVVRRVQDATGLKLGEAFGHGKESEHTGQKADRAQ
jgi:hypothetical protein